MVPEIWSVTNKIFCHSGLLFVLLPPMDPENQNFEKINKTLEDIIILQMCTINQSYDLWFLSYGVQQTNIFVILDHFLPFYPPPPSPTTQKIKILKKWKKKTNNWRYYHFTQMYHKWQSCHVWFLRYQAWQTGSFWTILCPLSTLTAQKIKILKKCKNTLIYHFTIVYHKS